MIGPGFSAVLAAAQADAPWAFQRIFDDLSPVVNGYVRARGAHEPEDVASEAFLSVFRAVQEFEGNEADFRSWVFTIVHRRLVDERRKRGRLVALTPIDAMPHDPSGGNSEREAVDALSSDWVREVLSILTDDQRDVILLRVIADLSVDEVATIMGRRPGAVRTLQHRALTQLRTRLAGDAEGVAGLVPMPTNQPKNRRHDRLTPRAETGSRDVAVSAIPAHRNTRPTASSSAHPTVVVNSTRLPRRSDP